VSTARPIDVVAGANWEGTGVIPDVAVPAEEALAAAHVAALRQVLEKLGASSDPASRELRDEAQGALSAYLERCFPRMPVIPRPAMNDGSLRDRAG
jgi:hypothetical protein